VLPASALQDVYTRVLQSFLVDVTPSSAVPGAAAPTGTFGSPPPAPAFGAGPMAPPPVNAPGAAFVGPLAGGEFSTGAVSPQQMETAGARAQSAIREALGSADLSHLTPADFEAVHARLEAMRAGGRLTAEQFAALSEGLAVLSQATPG
jgi:hypothetical protein